MSRIYFHTQHEGTREVLGAERAHMGMMCQDLASGLIPHFHDSINPLLVDTMRARLARLGNTPAYRDTVGLFFRQVDSPVFHYQGTALGNFELLLNTVLAIGSDSLCLLARLHGQCEIHGYVEGPHRAWMAGLIRDGLDSGVYRKEAGWDGVAELLEQSDMAPVVTSYSVTESFPNDDVAEWIRPEGADEDAWGDLAHDQQWEFGLAGLRNRSVDLTDWRPDNLRTLFGHAKTMFDVINQDLVKRTVT